VSGTSAVDASVDLGPICLLGCSKKLLLISPRVVGGHTLQFKARHWSISTSFQSVEIEIELPTQHPYKCRLNWSPFSVCFASAGVWPLAQLATLYYSDRSVFPRTRKLSDTPLTTTCVAPADHMPSRPAGRARKVVSELAPCRTHSGKIARQPCELFTPCSILIFRYSF